MSTALPTENVQQGDATARSRFIELTRVAHLLSLHETRDELCREAVRLGTERLGLDRLSIWLYLDDSTNLHGTYGTDECGGIRDERDQQYLGDGKAFGLPEGENRDPVLIRKDIDLYNDQAQPVGEGEHASVLMWDGNQVIGILCADNLLSRRSFTSEDREILLIYSMTIATLLSRREAQEAKKESEELFERIFETAGVGIAIVDEQGRWTHANQELADLFHVTRSEVLNLTWQDLTHPNHLEPNLSLFKRAWAGEIPGYALEKLYTRPDGTQFWGQLNTKVVSDHAGKPKFIISCMQDITNLKETEAELESRVQVRTNELKLAVENMESFSYSVSHDLRSPLRAINGFSNLIREDYAHKLDLEAQDYLRRIEKASAKMGDLIDALLNVSRISRAEIDRTHVNITQLIEELVLERALEDFSGQINVAPDLQVLADRRLIGALFLNLISNACKFTKPRGENALVEIGKEGHALFVRDNGEGFDPSMAHKLFKPFSRLHGEEEFPGSGIGLATVHRIVQRHGGTIWAESKVGAGAAFYFTIPSS